MNAPSREDSGLRTLLAFVAVFAPASAPALLSRLGGPEADALRSRGIRLAGQPRRARLLALAEALDAVRAARGAQLAPSVVQERPRTLEALERWLGGTREASAVPSRALRRLLEERPPIGRGRSAVLGPSGALEPPR